jgi:hypothetical protein
MSAHRSISTAFVTALAVSSCGLLLGSASALATGFRFSSSFGSAGEGPGQLEGPRGLAVEASTGDVFVVDSANMRVEKFNAEGTVLGEFDGAETPQKELSNAYGVAVDNDPSSPSYEDVYVAVVGAVAAVDKFKPKTPGSNSYEYVCQLTGPGGGCVKENGAPTTTFRFPYGLAVDGSGNLYVAQQNFGAPFVYEFDSAGDDVATIENEHLEALTALTVDASGDIYVANSPFSAANLVKLNASHEYQSTVDTDEPTAVTVDPEGDVYVVDAGGGYRVSEYDPAGKSVEEFGAGEIGESEGIAYSPTNGDLYVTDLEHDEVHVFERGASFALPVVTIAPVEPTAAGATLKGSVNPEGEAGTHWYFAWGETEAYGSRTPVEEVAQGVGPVPVEAKLTGLVPNTTYHDQLFAYNKHDESKPAGSGDQKIMTEAIAPVLGGEPASFLAAKAATLTAKVNPEHSPTEFHFDYGTSEGYGQETPAESAGSGFASAFVSQRVEGLTPATTYHFRVVATNEQGMTERGPDETFTTGAESPPLAITGAASGITQTGAIVSGTVDPEGYATGYVLELGTTSTYGTQISGSVGPGAEAQAVSVALQGLAPSTTYHFRFAAVNRNGTSYGADDTLTTAGYSYSLVQPPTQLLLPAPPIVFPFETTTPKPRPEKPKKRVKKPKSKHKKALKRASRRRR